MKIIEIMGSDQRVCQAARVSLLRDQDERSEADDIKLIKYLRKHKHTSPFEHVRVTVKLYNVNSIMAMHLFKYADMTPGDVAGEWMVTLDIRNLSVCLAAAARWEEYRLLAEVFPASLHKDNEPTMRTVGVSKEGPIDRIDLYGGQGFVELIDYLGHDGSRDEHRALTFCVKVPLFISKQHMRHRTWSFNEASRRYTSEDVEFWQPTEWRKQAKKNLQASDGLVHEDDALQLDIEFEHFCARALDIYEWMLNAGVCREQARAVLPQGMMTRYYATVSLSNLKAFLRLRIHPGAQAEIQEMAEAMRDLAASVFPTQMEGWE